jgi:hypoxanthine phosphoribosyltransferase
MTYRQVCSVDNNKVTITLPEDFKGKTKVVVVVDDLVDTKAQKFELLKKASNDPLFLADIKEIHEDFDAIDEENL